MRDYDIPRPRRGQYDDRRVAGGLPVRARGERCGVSTAYFDGTPDQLGRIRTWCCQASRLDDDLAAPIILAMNELVVNAMTHTASGGRCGRVKVSVEALPGEIVLVSVTDDGPRACRPISLPRLAERDDPLSTGGRGLRLVADLAEKWWWTGRPGDSLTVWALIDPHRYLDL
ncbi:ATP-binding protein [Nocardiopsis sp. NPDC049922]|uniref:ATP-binding protein n=1 Tax=Nocardiopsis sp. NPDC049922 TaxID=3155157 RepID=UPI0033E56518